MTTNGEQTETQMVFSELMEQRYGGPMLEWKTADRSTVSVYILEVSGLPNTSGIPNSVWEVDCRRSGESKPERHLMFMSTDCDERIIIRDRLLRRDKRTRKAVETYLSMQIGQRRVLGWDYKDKAPKIMVIM